MRHSFFPGRIVVGFAALATLFAIDCMAAEPTTDVSDAKAYRQSVDRAVRYLGSIQGTDGSYARFAGPGVTALVTTAVIRSGRGPSDPLVARSLKWLEKHIQPNGGIYQTDTLYRNYETCLAMLCFKEANRNGQYDLLLTNAEKYIKSAQWDETEGHDLTSTSFGGAGYGKHSRPDMSNTQFMLDALKAMGRGADDPAIQKALVFVSRCQNHESEHNMTKFPSKNPNGGFYYTIAAGGSSQAGETPNGGLRSYGSMTYAGLKSMIYAGVGKDDPRVKAAFQWIQKHYTLETNPVMGSSGLYYYYHTFAKALDAMDLDTIETPDGIEHDWRRELRAELIRRQQPNGSWVNENARWLEGEPSLVTGYALLAMAYCHPDARSSSKASERDDKRID